MLLLKSTVLLASHQKFGVIVNLDYKVTVKVIALQLKSMLVNVSHPYQIYTIPALTIFDNQYLAQDLLHLACRVGLIHPPILGPGEGI